MDTDVFVERVFDLDGGTLPVRFCQPERQPDGEFGCRWTIHLPDRPFSCMAHGEDGVQALMLAMRTVHTELVSSEAYQAGRLTLFDQGDLDLPPTWGTGALYNVPPPLED